MGGRASGQARLDGAGGGARAADGSVRQRRPSAAFGQAVEVSLHEGSKGGGPVSTIDAALDVIHVFGGEGHRVGQHLCGWLFHNFRQLRWPWRC